LGWIVGEDGLIYRSSDGGESWTQVLVNTNKNLDDVFFLNKNFGWIAGDDGTLLHSVNTGLSWRKEYSRTGNDLKGIHFLNDRLGYLTGFNGTILKYKYIKSSERQKPILTARNIPFQVPENETTVTVALINKQGLIVRNLIEDVTLNSGDYIFNTGSMLNEVTDGIYYLRLTIGQKSTIEKQIFIR
jgi:hypothetical protein